MSGSLDTIFYIAILIMSVVAHEVAHGVAAERFGDPTARMAGRLTLNPLKHLDLFGSLILPFILITLHAQPIGWAKPVPVNPNNLRSKFGKFMVACAGILTNFSIAILAALFLKIVALLGVVVNHANPSPLVLIIDGIILINILLGIFNLMPVPPLDGFKIIFSAFPEKIQRYERTLDFLGIPVLFLLIFLFGSYLSPIVYKLMSLLLGV